MGIELTRDKAFELIQDVLNQLSDNNDKISLPVYAIENKNDPLGIKNVNFSDDSASNVNDDRYNIWMKERLTQGFDSTELWSLSNTISQFVLPRLKEFKKIHHGYPGSIKNPQEWDELLDDMIFAFEYHLDDYNEKSYVSKDGSLIDTEDYSKFKFGITKFAEYFMDLWD